MTYDPLSDVADHQIEVGPETIQQLKALRESADFSLIPGVDTAQEKERLIKVLHPLFDNLIAGLPSNPSKLWVLAQFKQALEQVLSEDTEAREHFGIYLEQIMDALSIESSDGLLSFYLGGI